MIVVGAGAAGIIAAWRAGSLGARVLLLEKTNRIGTKILISGGGKCNITHDGDIESVLAAFRPEERRFLKPSCYRFTNTQIVKMLTDRGLEVYTRPDGRIFPVHQTAKDVVAILRQYLEEAAVTVKLLAPVTDLKTSNGKISGVETREMGYRSKTVVLCVGGSSYPSSGTTGDGWPWARGLGHSTTPIVAALAPMDTEGSMGRFPGVSLRDVVLKARQNGKEIARWRGDLLFTHHGVSGPCALGISRVVAEFRKAHAVHLEIDLRPDQSFEQLNDSLQDLVRESTKVRVSTILGDSFPSRLQDPFFESCQIDKLNTVVQLDKKARNRLIETLKGWKIGKVTGVPLEKGECVAGGVSLEEVDSQTMRSKFVENLFLAGEMLDIAGPVGGYNLQAAFATGFVAGDSAARQAQR